MDGGGPTPSDRASPSLVWDRQVAVYASTHRLLARLDDGTASGWEFLGTTRWNRFLSIASSTPTAVIGLDDPDERHTTRLGSLRFLATGHPLILALHRNPAWIPVLARAGIRATAVVWWRDLEARLPEALEQCARVRPLEIAEGLIEAADGLSVRLVTALRHAVLRRPPLVSVKRWTAEVGVSRSTLFHHWRHSLGHDAPVKPKGFVDWVVLVYGWSLWKRLSHWGAVADQLGVSQRTLRRICGRRLQSSLVDLTAARGAGTDDPGSRFLKLLRRMLEGAAGTAPEPSRQTGRR